MMIDCPPLEVIEPQIEAWRARDAAAFVEFYAPDAVIVDHPGEVTMTGRAEILEQYTNSFLEMPADAELTIGNRIVSGEYVIDQEVIRGDGFAGQVVAIYRVQSCLITRVDFLPWVNDEDGGGQ